MSHFRLGITGGATLPTKDAVWQGRICPDINAESTGETGGIRTGSLRVRGRPSNHYAIRASLCHHAIFPQNPFTFIINPLAQNPEAVFILSHGHLRFPEFSPTDLLQISHFFQMQPKAGRTKTCPPGWGKCLSLTKLGYDVLYVSTDTLFQLVSGRPFELIREIRTYRLLLL